MQYSRTISDLIELEESFKYNLELLNIKSSEIERCNFAITKHENLRRDNLREITDLKCTCKILEDKLKYLERQSSYENEIYVTNIKRYEYELKRCEDDRKNQRDVYEMELINIRKRYDANYARSKREKDEIDDVKEQFLEEQTRMAHILKELSSENHDLMEKLRENELANTTDTFNYKNQLHQLNDCNSMLRKELQKFSDSFHDQSDELTDIRRERDNLLNEIEEAKREMSKLQDNNDLMKVEIANYNENLQINKFNDDDTRCYVKDHRNYDNLIKQNQILQDVVKEMRKERKENLEYVKTMQDAEKKIEYLESVLDLLKKDRIDDDDENE